MHSYREEQFFGNEWGNLPMIFTSDFVTRENHWQIASWVTQKSLFTVTNVFFLYVVFSPPDIHGLACEKLSYLSQKEKFESLVNIFQTEKLKHEILAETGNFEFQLIYFKMWLHFTKYIKHFLLLSSNAPY